MGRWVHSTKPKITAPLPYLTLTLSFLSCPKTPRIGWHPLLQLLVLYQMTFSRQVSSRFIHPDPSSLGKQPSTG